MAAIIVLHGHFTSVNIQVTMHAVCRQIHALR